MDFLLTYYTDKFANIEGNIFELFTEFYNLDLSPVDSWLQTQFENKVEKDDTLSTFYRQEGNKCYARKDLLKSLELYTKSLCCATPNGQEYGLALANRSAVSFEMREFSNCLRDIELCFKTNYPKHLRPKIYLRKAECYCETGLKDELEKCMVEALQFLHIENVPDKEKHILKMNKIKKMPLKGHNNWDGHKENLYELPEFDEGESDSFKSASSKLKMSYDETRGRHVLAKKNIRKGEVLFVEKAFLFAPIFKDEKEFHPFKCYNCLKDVISSVPCHSCTLCVYCNEKCRTVSWEDCHRWECEGMQANIWCDLGIGFPALKAILKGVKSGFKTIKGDHTEDLKHFGDKEDNYPYFNRLVSHIYKNKNAAPFILMATIIVNYLKNYTNFFAWYLTQQKCPKNNFTTLIKYIGGLLTKHIAQLSCNSSIIEHWTYTTSDLLFPDVMSSVACGMFPSVSILNHSCRPNITNFFVCDTIVVKAVEDINENEEIFNCYGVDYRGLAKRPRQRVCKSLYHFECKCVICSDPTKEVEMFDSYICRKCNGLVRELPENCTVCRCVDCGYEYAVRHFKMINEEAQKYLKSKEGHKVEVLLKCLKIRQKILYKHHKDFEEIYYRLYSYYLETGDVKNMFKYFQLWLENEKARKGESYRVIGTKLYEAALAILHCLKNRQPKHCINLKTFLQNVENMIREAKVILNLYYPTHITNRLNKKIEFISNK